MLKRGLSTIITTLIIILISIVAIGIIWVVINNILSGSADEISLGKFTLDLQIKNVNVDDVNDRVTLSVKRNPGKGDLSGIKFIVSDGTTSESFENTTITLNELGELIFVFDLATIQAENVLTISISPIFITGSGKKIFGHVLSLYNVQEGTACTPDCADPSTVACGTPITDNNGCITCPSGTQCGTGETCIGGTCQTTPTVSYVARSFSSSTVSLGGSVDVILTVDIINDEDLYVLEEGIPSAWTVTDDAGGATSNSSKLAWAVISGAVDTTYTYIVQAPSVVGSYDFGGMYLFEPLAVATPVCGNGICEQSDDLPPTIKETESCIQDCEFGTQGSTTVTVV